MYCKLSAVVQKTDFLCSLGLQNHNQSNPVENQNQYIATRRVLSADHCAVVWYTKVPLYFCTQLPQQAEQRFASERLGALVISQPFSAASWLQEQQEQ